MAATPPARNPALQKKMSWADINDEVDGELPPLPAFIAPQPPQPPREPASAGESMMAAPAAAAAAPPLMPPPAIERKNPWKVCTARRPRLALAAISLTPARSSTKRPHGRVPRRRPRRPSNQRRLRLRLRLRARCRAPAAGRS
jgi:hypothetical protein